MNVSLQIVSNLMSVPQGITIMILYLMVLLWKFHVFIIIYVSFEFNQRMLNNPCIIISKPLCYIILCRWLSISLAEVFDVHGTPYNKLNMSCVYFPNETVAKWTWYDPEDDYKERFDIPQCLARCSSNPLVIKGTHKNWTKEVIYRSWVQNTVLHCKADFSDFFPIFGRIFLLKIGRNENFII